MVESVKAASDIYAPVRRHGDRSQRRAGRTSPPRSTTTRKARAGSSSMKVTDTGELAKLMDSAAYAKFVRVSVMRYLPLTAG